jgi:hypothetical protein
MIHSLKSGSEWSARFFALAVGACLLCPVGCAVEPLDDGSGESDDADELEQGLDDATKLCISKCRSDADTGIGMCKEARHLCRQTAKDKAERQQCGENFRLCKMTRRACIQVCKDEGKEF